MKQLLKEWKQYLNEDRRDNDRIAKLWMDQTIAKHEGRYENISQISTISINWSYFG